MKPVAENAATLARCLLVAGLALAAAGCSSGSDGGVVSGPGTVTLNEVQFQVFSPSCAVSGCHLDPGAQMGLDLSAGSAAGNLIGVDSVEVGTLLRVDPGNAADSYLYMKLIGDERIEGDPMPAEAGPLSAGELNLVEAWINQGAQ